MNCCVDKAYFEQFFRDGMASVLLFCVAMTSVPATAQVYQWKDADGKSVITDTPPPGAKSRQISKAAPAEVPKANAGSNDAGKKPESKKTAVIKTPAEQAAEEKRQSELKEYCDSARSRLTELDSGMRIGAMDAKGERYVLTDEQRSTEGAKLRRGMQDAKCP